MKISSRDRRALTALACAVVVFAILSAVVGGGGSTAVVEPANDISAAEARLARVRELAALAPQKQKELDRLAGELKGWESGLIRSETVQQAQAQLLRIVRRLGAGQEPPLEFASEELGGVRPLGNGENYGEALVSVSFECAVEQLVNLLADLTGHPDAVVTEEIRITSGDPKKKTLRVRLTLAGLVPRELLPERKGLAGS